MPENSVQLFIAFYTDEDVHQQLAQKIRERGFDAVSAHEEGNFQVDDEKHLEYATAQHRAVLTHNQRHFEPLHRKWLSEGRDHAGIILSPQIELGELLRRILRLLDHVTADEMQNNLRYLSDFAERRK